MTILQLSEGWKGHNSFRALATHLPSRVYHPPSPRNEQSWAAVPCRHRSHPSVPTTYDPASPIRAGICELVLGRMRHCLEQDKGGSVNGDEVPTAAGKFGSCRGELNSRMARGLDELDLGVMSGKTQCSKGMQRQTGGRGL